MRPVKKNILISRIEPKLKTESGIILKASIEPDRAIIEAIGSEVTETKVGEKVFLDWNKARKLDGIGDKELYLVVEDDIVFVYDEV
jgi:co-chaperonin GroES (HSP10)